MIFPLYTAIEQSEIDILPTLVYTGSKKNVSPQTWSNSSYCKEILNEQMVNEYRYTRKLYWLEGTTIGQRSLKFVFGKKKGSETSEFRVEVAPDTDV